MRLGRLFLIAAVMVGLVQLEARSNRLDARSARLPFYVGWWVFPDTVPPFYWCQFMANTDGYVGPYRFEWYVDYDLAYVDEEINDPDPWVEIGFVQTGWHTVHYRIVDAENHWAHSEIGKAVFVKSGATSSACVP